MDLIISLRPLVVNGNDTRMTMSTLPKYHNHTLSNGLQIYVIPQDNDSGVITTNIFYDVGSGDEIMGKTGIAHMLEHMNFKSTKNLSEGEFDTIIKSHGGVNNASTGFDYTQYYIKSASSKLDISLQMYAELMQHLNLTDEEFQKERDVVAEERRWRTDNNPIGYLYFRLFNTHFVSHSYHWTPIGFMEDILSWNIADIREFHDRFYRPNNAILVIAGDIAPQIVFDSAAKHFGAIENKDAAHKCSLIHTNIPSEPPKDGALRLEINKAGNKSDTIAIVYSIPNFKHPDQVALSTISELLSAGKSSSLHQKLVSTSLASQVSAYNMELKHDGVFILLAIANPGIDISKIEQILQDEIELLKTTLVSHQEIDKIKINTKKDFLHSIDSSSSLSSLFGSYLTMGDLDPLLNYEENLDKITPNKLQEVATRYFDNSKSTTIIMKKDQEEK